MATQRDQRRQVRRTWVLAWMAPLVALLGAALSAATNIATNLSLPGWTRNSTVIFSATGALTLMLMVFAAVHQRLTSSAEPFAAGADTSSEAATRRPIVGPLLLLLLAFPVSITVLLSLLDPVQFGPLAVVDRISAVLSPVVGESVASGWTRTSTDVLARQHQWGGWLVALALVLWAGCRPPLHAGHGSRPSPWLVTAGWLSAFASMACGAGRWIFVAYVGLAVVFTWAQTGPLPYPVRDSAEHMRDSLIGALLAPSWMMITVVAAAVPRFTGRRQRHPGAAPGPRSENAQEQMLDLAHRRMNAASTSTATTLPSDDAAELPTSDVLPE